MEANNDISRAKFNTKLEDLLYQKRDDNCFLFITQEKYDALVREIKLIKEKPKKNKNDYKKIGRIKK